MDAAYPHVADRLFGRAHAVEPHAFRAIIESPLARRIIGGERVKEDSGKDNRKAKRQRLSSTIDGEWCKVGGGMGDYFVTSQGIAIVPVMGLLGQRYDWLAAVCGWTTYEGLAASFDAMGKDYRVKAVMMDVESPGGECAGMLDIADKIIAARDGGKPIWAVANSYAASAAYAIAGSAQRLIVPRLGSVGSIGAVCMHIDQSAFDEHMGLKYTAIFSGDRKMDGWEHAPLSSEAKRSFQDSVDYAAGKFADLVGRQGRLSAEEALATEADMFFDQLAVEAKLADGVGSFDEALADLSDRVNGMKASNTTLAAAAVATTGDANMKTKAAQTDAPAAPMAEAIAAATGVPAAEIVAAAAVEQSIAAAPAAPAGAEAAAGTPATPKAEDNQQGEVCPQCGKKYMPEDGGEESALAAVLETLDLCAIANTSIKQVREFIAQKTPTAQVREKLAALAAQTTQETEIDPVPKQTSKTHGRDEMFEKINKEFGVKPPKP